MQTEIGRYLYFIFAPTLIYRDEYPRTGKSVSGARACTARRYLRVACSTDDNAQVRWFSVITHLLNVAASILFTYMVFRTWYVAARARQRACAPHVAAPCVQVCAAL